MHGRLPPITGPTCFCCHPGGDQPSQMLVLNRRHLKGDVAIISFCCLAALGQPEPGPCAEGLSPPSRAIHSISSFTGNGQRSLGLLANHGLREKWLWISGQGPRWSPDLALAGW